MTDDYKIIIVYIGCTTQLGPLGCTAVHMGDFDSSIFVCVCVFFFV